ncbi:beta-ketoacyl-ACP synthase II [Alkalibacter rhizosphaerae]|uniref:3-oxoacyl-[acyl-carrier-protein] synthase 2 n=1 Tax=Alkalibacter rhizosphaerae TaxID=2815577 RepID=A0A974XGC7_9FIRM|nr:beta-ketoacyl-ACP synthase II [Alkalibacter rhizosphaerae]QSX07803.1 beta-ketoacyl-ACP synthase II [Alkalibacter rhizosphaerae]
MNRVVITGLGAISPLGETAEEFWTNAKKGTCGIGLIDHFDTTGYEVTLAAQVKEFHPETYIHKREIKRLDRYSQFGIYASCQAYEDAGLKDVSIDRERFGILVSSGIGGIETFYEQTKKQIEKGFDRISPYFIPMIIPNMAAGNIAIALEAKGPCLSIVTACASATNAIGEAFHKIRMGIMDVAIAGGSEASICETGIAGFMAMKALSTSTDPNRASIPFDKERDGFVMGEGAGVLVLESLDHALNRNAKIYGELVGYGATCDAHHITSPAPEGEGGGRAMKMAVQDAGLQLTDVDYINAHGTSTYYNDVNESAAIKNLFGDHCDHLAVSSTKSMVGHLLGASGGVEAIACVKALQEGFLPPTINYRVPDPECTLDYIPNEGRSSDATIALSNSLGFGGHNATLAFKKWEGDV